MILRTVGELPKTGAILAIDFGGKNIGLAITDNKQQMDLPYNTLKRKSNKENFVELNKIIEDEKVVGIMMGLPLNAMGQETQSSKVIREFTKSFSKQNDISIVYVNEHLTSFHAEEFLINTVDMGRKRRKEVIDKLSACYILRAGLGL